VTRPLELLLFLYAESPVHAGASDSLDVIDLPVQRESATTYPVIWGQSLKGALRQAAEDAIGRSLWTKPLVEQLFGRAVDSSGDGDGTSAGLLAVGDAQLVAMPVPTLRQTFAWVTSELALGRLARKYRAIGGDLPGLPTVASDQGRAAHADWTGLGDQVLGPCVLPMAEVSDDLTAWAQRLADDAIGREPMLAYFHDKLARDLLLVGADAMPLLLRECTELSARVQLDDGKTVRHGPFYSEYLPAETLLATSLTLREGHQSGLAALRGLFADGPLQVGGDETLGKGLVWTRLLEAG
jgi:CRISPR-associated protein Cmr4